MKNRVDVNGLAEMSNGTIIVNGPAANNDGTFTITDGYLLAVGNSGMAQLPGASST
ncbi:hypothetical protein HNV11_19935 [Spirosoma taeanense]|uniref:Uncharacterized protein n=1 Tax=Spirosoma taeanense TaxID=2735870 RepID=A0A6M5YBG7_9BACT|nr:hypothetical protein [Spirosoma taeanense]QJW91488.1 hypothetical protein HNV11_19935 [Spirosoma taeanense]